MSGYGYDEELLAEIQMLAALVELAGTVSCHLTTVAVDGALGLAPAEAPPISVEVMRPQGGDASDQPLTYETP